MARSLEQERQSIEEDERRLAERKQRLAERQREEAIAAIDAYFAQADLLDASRRRLVRIGEFQQLALDVIIREQFPEFRERILAEVDKRVELHHGAR